MRIRSLTRSAARGIAGSPLRSWLIGGCALLVAALLLTTVLVVRGAQDSLNRAQERLGADVVVVPRGSETQVEGALLLGNATNTYMPMDYVARISHLPGVAVASPQLYMMSMSDASCCSVPNMLMVAYDSRTDFALEPWLKQKLGGDLALGQAVGGKNVFVPAGQNAIKLYGYDFKLVGNLESTGTNLDQTLFMTFQTAYDMERVSQLKAEVPLPILKDKATAVMIKLDPRADRARVTKSINSYLPGVTAIASPDMFGAYRSQASGVLHTLLVVLVLMIVLSLAVTALVFWMSVNERRRQIGVMRALGATQKHVLFSFLTEAVMLALGGGAVGAVVAATCLYLFRDALVTAFGFPFLFPSAASLAALLALGLVLALAVVGLAALVPALRAAREEPARSMRE